MSAYYTPPVKSGPETRATDRLNECEIDLAKRAPLPPYNLSSSSIVHHQSLNANHAGYPSFFVKALRGCPGLRDFAKDYRGGGFRVALSRVRDCARVERMFSDVARVILARTRAECEIGLHNGSTLDCAP
jgi:hypothetical protein